MKDKPTIIDIDPYILPYVMLLNAHGIDTEGSCQGHLNQKYPTGYWKPQCARISGRLKHLSDLLKIEQLLVGEKCHCSTCKHFTISAGVRADACGIDEPIRYFYSIHFDRRITKGFLAREMASNKLLWELNKELRIGLTKRNEK